VTDASGFQAGKQIVLADGAASEILTISEVDTSNDVITVESPLSNAYAGDAYVTQVEGGRKFSFDPAEFTETQSAQNARVRIDGYPSGDWIERQSNVFSDVILDVTMELQAPTSGDAVTVTVNKDKGAVKAKVQDFVDKYNAVRQFINAQTSYDAETEDAGALMGNYLARFVESDLRNLVVGTAPGFDDSSDTYTLLGHVGIETKGTADDETMLGTLDVDDSKLDEALSDNFEAAIDVLSAHFSGASDSDYVRYYQSSEILTQPGKYDVEVDFDGSGNVTGGRMKLTSESTFREAEVNGNYLIGADDNPEESLWVEAQWDGASTTQSAVVRLRQGIVDAMSSSLEEMMDGMTGILSQQQDGYSDISDGLQERIDEHESKLDDMEDRLINKYARLEQALTRMQGMLSSAQSMAGSMFSSQA
jgi:flagellar hook-associated protein 2